VLAFGIGCPLQGEIELPLNPGSVYNRQG
jgi:hypothetical protein